MKLNINFFLIILALYPGLLLFSTEAGLSLRLDFFGANILVAVLFKWIYIFICAFFILTQNNILKIKFNPIFILLFILIMIATFITSSNNFDSLDGYYIVYWFLFAILVLDLVAFKDTSYIKLAKLISILLIIDIFITFMYSAGGGIFHQHRFSGIFSFLLSLVLCEFILNGNHKNQKMYLIILLVLSIILIYTTIWLNSTRQMLPYAISTALISISLFNNKNIINNYELKNRSIFYCFIALGLFLLFSVIPMAHLAGYLGDSIYQLINFSDKERSIYQEAGREYLFSSLIRLVFLNDIQWMLPINFSDGLLGGAVSAHNFWLQTYIEFGLIYLLLWIFFLYFLLLKIVSVMNIMRLTYRISIFLLILSHLILLNLNDEGGFYSRAPAISLYLLVLFGLWVRVKNYQPSRRYVLLTKD